jgi:hypothetical protein
LRVAAVGGGRRKSGKRKSESKTTTTNVSVDNDAGIGKDSDVDDDLAESKRACMEAQASVPAQVSPQQSAQQSAPVSTRSTRKRKGVSYAALNGGVDCDGDDDDNNNDCGDDDDDYDNGVFGVGAGRGGKAKKPRKQASKAKKPRKQAAAATLLEGASGELDHTGSVDGSGKSAPSQATTSAPEVLFPATQRALDSAPPASNSPAVSARSTL